MISEPSGSGKEVRSSFLELYFGRGKIADIGDARSGLVTKSVTARAYAGANEKRQAAILDQYKLYVEMADRISARRALANTFFLTLNTGIFALFGVFWKDRPEGSVWLLALPAIVLVGQTLAWFWLLRSYRQLNTGKYVVIGALEELLPVSPYWRSEWVVLGQGKDKARYWPLTHLEQWVPLLFTGAYVAGFVIAVTVS
jgi:hypothetical protein